MVNEYQSHTPRSVMVTGGCGFIGSNFINHLAAVWPESKIVNLDKLRSESSPDNVDPSVRQQTDRYQLIVGDYGDSELIDRTLREHSIDTVVHFAAMTHVDESYELPLETFQNNVVSVAQFLQACIAYGRIKRFVHISTDEVYGDSEMGPDAVPKKESAHLNPTNPYAASKAACEQVVHAFRHSHGLPVVMLRMNNVYGPRQYHSKVIPKFVKKLMMDEPLTIQGNGQQLRNWMYVADACDGILQLTEAGEIGEIYNLGTRFEYSILDLALAVRRLIAELQGIENLTSKLIQIPDRLYNDQRYLIDSSKIKELIGWEAKTTFEEGLKKTVQWYLDQEEGKQFITNIKTIA